MLISLPSFFAYSFSSLYTKERILKATYLPLNSFINSPESSFELDPVINKDIPFRCKVLQAKLQLGHFAPHLRIYIYIPVLLLVKHALLMLARYLFS